MARRFILPSTLAGTLNAQYPSLADRVREQSAFVSRFADEAAARALLGKPFSAAEAGNRAASYSGAGRAEWYRGKEVLSGQGFVYDYECRDDPSSCVPCSKAATDGPYLANAGNFPGSVCRGRGRCRCRRVGRYDPEEAARLKGAA